MDTSSGGAASHNGRQWVQGSVLSHPHSSAAGQPSRAPLVVGAFSIILFLISTHGNKYKFKKFQQFIKLNKIKISKKSKFLNIPKNLKFSKELNIFKIFKKLISYSVFRNSITQLLPWLTSQLLTHLLHQKTTLTHSFTHLLTYLLNDSLSYSIIASHTGIEWMQGSALSQPTVIGGQPSLSSLVVGITQLLTPLIIHSAIHSDPHLLTQLLILILELLFNPVYHP